MTGPAETTSTSPGPVVVPPVDPPSQPSCVPNPVGSVKDSHEKELQKATAFFCDQYAKNPTIINGLISIGHTVIVGDRRKAGGRDYGPVVNEAYEYPPSLGNQDDVYELVLAFGVVKPSRKA